MKSAYRSRYSLFRFIIFTNTIIVNDLSGLYIPQHMEPQLGRFWKHGFEKIYVEWSQAIVHTAGVVSTDVSHLH